MSLDINWMAFVQVFAAALAAGILVVGFYAIGLRMMVRSGRVPVVAPADFTDAISVVTPKEARRAEKAAAKAAKKNPLTQGQKNLALVAAMVAFGLCAIAVIAGIALIIWG